MRFLINNNAVKPEQMVLRRTVPVDGAGERRTCVPLARVHPPSTVSNTPVEQTALAFAVVLFWWILPTFLNPMVSINLFRCNGTLLAKQVRRRNPARQGRDLWSHTV
jgi:hypothetical protein